MKTELGKNHPPMSNLRENFDKEHIYVALKCLPQIAYELCISFLLPLEQTTENLVPWNNTNVSGQKSEMSLTGLGSGHWQGWFPLEALGENPFPAFSSF